MKELRPLTVVLSLLLSALSPKPAGPAVRRLRPGMTLGYAYLIYNAKLDKATGRPQLFSRTRVFPEGKLVYDQLRQDKYHFASRWIDFEVMK